MEKKYSRIGELLVKEKYINASDLNYALNIQRKDCIHKKIGQILMEKDLIEKNRLREALGIFFNIETVDLTSQKIDIKAVNQIDLHTAFEVPCIPYKFDIGPRGLSLFVALPDPLNYRYVDNLNFLINYPLVPVFAHEDEIINQIKFYSSQFKK